MATPLLDVQDLHIHYDTDRGVMKAVEGVSFTVEAGRHLGLIGESGCGKTTTGRSLMRVMPRNGRIPHGRAVFKGRDLMQLSDEEMRKLRWRELSMVPQASMDALNPVYRVGKQLSEILTVRGDYSKGDSLDRSAELFELVGLSRDRLENYPHEFSGGMRQRAVIAMALALDPDMVIADEPVTALDVIVQRQVLRTIQELQDRLSLSVIMITHDISVVAETCDEVAVMYAGKIVEWAPVRRFFSVPVHPYTLGLQNAYPNLMEPDAELISIEGYPPNLVNPPSGCRFAPRCPFAQERCFVEEPPLVDVGPDHKAACHRDNEVEMLRASAKMPSTWQAAQASEQA